MGAELQGMGFQQNLHLPELFLHVLDLDLCLNTETFKPTQDDT